MKSLGLISRPESAVLTRDGFDHELTNCSIDNVADSEAGVSQPGVRYTRVSGVLTNEGIDPVLTICNLPPGLIKEKPKLIKIPRQIYQRQEPQLRATVLKAKVPQNSPQLLCNKNIQDYKHLLNLKVTKQPTQNVSGESSQVNINTMKTGVSQQQSKSTNEKYQQNLTQPTAKQTFQNQPEFSIQKLSDTEITRKHPHTAQLLNEMSDSSQRSVILVNKENPHEVSQAIIKGPFQSRPHFLIQKINLNSTHMLATQITRSCPPLLTAISLRKNTQQLNLNKDSAHKDTSPQNKDPLYMRLKYLNKNKLLTCMQLTPPEVGQDNIQCLEIPQIKRKLSPEVPESHSLLTEISSHNDLRILNTKTSKSGETFLNENNTYDITQILAQNSEALQSQPNYEIQNKLPDSTQLMASKLTQNHSQPNITDKQAHNFNLEFSHHGGKFFNEGNVQNVMAQDGSQSQPQFLIQNQSLDSKYLLTSKLTQNHQQLLNEATPDKESHIFNVETSHYTGKYLNREKQENVTEPMTQDDFQSESQFVVQNQPLDLTHIFASKLSQNHQQLLNEAIPNEKSHIFNPKAPDHVGKFFDEEFQQNITQHVTQDDSENQQQFVIQNPTHAFASKLTQNHQQLLNEATPHNESHIFNVEYSRHVGKCLNPENTQTMQPVIQETVESQPQFVIQNQPLDLTQFIDPKITHGQQQLLNDPSSHNMSIFNVEMGENVTQLMTQEASQSERQFEDQHELLDSVHLLASKLTQSHDTQPLSEANSLAVSHIFNSGGKFLTDDNPQNLTHSMSQEVSQCQPQFVIHDQLLDLSHHVASKITQSHAQLNSRNEVDVFNRGIIQRSGKYFNEENPQDMTQSVIQEAAQNQSELRIQNELFDTSHLLASKMTQNHQQLVEERNSLNDEHVFGVEASRAGRKFLNEENSLNTQSQSMTEEVSQSQPNLKTIEIINRTHLLGTGVSPDCVIILNKRKSPNIQHTLTAQGLQSGAQLLINDTSQNHTLLNKESSGHRPPGLIKKKIHSRITILSDDIIKAPSSDSKEQGSSIDMNKILRKYSSKHVVQSKEKRTLDNTLVAEHRKQHSIKKKMHKSRLNLEVSQHCPQFSNKDSLDNAQVINKTVLPAVMRSKLLRKESSQTGKPLHDDLYSVKIMPSNIKNAMHLKGTETAQNHSQFLYEEKTETFIPNKDDAQQDAEILAVKSSKDKMQVQVEMNDQISTDGLPCQNTGVLHRNKQLFNENLQASTLYNTEIPRRDESSNSTEHLKNVTQLSNKEVPSILNRETLQCSDQHLNEGILQNVGGLQNTEIAQDQVQFLKNKHSGNEIQLLNTKVLQTGLQFLNHDNSQNDAHSFDNDSSPFGPEFVHDENSQNATHSLDTKDPQLMHNEKLQVESIVPTADKEESLKYKTQDILQLDMERVNSDNLKCSSFIINRDDSVHYTDILSPNETAKLSKSNAKSQRFGKFAKIDFSKIKPPNPANEDSDETSKISKPKNELKQAIKRVEAGTSECGPSNSDDLNSDKTAEYSQSEMKNKLQQAMKHVKPNATRSSSPNSTNDDASQTSNRPKCKNKTKPQHAVKRIETNVSKRSSLNSDGLDTNDDTKGLKSENEHESEQRVKAGISGCSPSNSYDEPIVDNIKLMPPKDETEICSIFKNKTVTVNIKRIHIDTSKCPPEFDGDRSLMKILTTEETSVSKTVPRHSTRITSKEKTSEPQPSTSTAVPFSETEKMIQKKSEPVKSARKSVKSKPKTAKVISKTAKATSKTAESTSYIPRSLRSMRSGTITTRSKAQSMAHTAQSTSNYAQPTINTNKSWLKPKKGTPRIEVIMDESTIIDSKNAKPKSFKDLDCYIFTSNRGRKLLVINKIRYRMNNVSEDKISWRCTTHERFGCQAKVHTLGNKVAYFFDQHKTDAPGLDNIPLSSSKKGL